MRPRPRLHRWKEYHRLPPHILARHHPQELHRQIYERDHEKENISSAYPKVGA
jgi:hypothetical protein